MIQRRGCERSLRPSVQFVDTQVTGRDVGMNDRRYSILAQGNQATGGKMLETPSRKHRHPLLRWHPSTSAALIATVIALCIALGSVRGTRGAPGDDIATSEPSPFVVVLGVAQDGGRPQAGCTKACCAAAWRDSAARRRVACLALVDPGRRARWLIDATPDFRDQLRTLDALRPPESSPGLTGIFLTHAHIGHYTGLMQLGREVMGAHGVSVFAMPRLAAFLRSNGPWSQLVTLQNIDLRELQAEIPVSLGNSLAIRPFLVPHRDEYSETVGFRIEGPHRALAYVPDIDKWERWTSRVEELISTVDVAYLDGTFYGNGEIPNRDMREIPHPFIVETLARLAGLPPSERAKVRFIHLNHTNPALDADSPAQRAIEAAGCHVAVEGERFDL
jgi:pyrroloquinoline quinone biosynthesis protein B